MLFHFPARRKSPFFCHTYFAVLPWKLEFIEFKLKLKLPKSKVNKKSLGLCFRGLSPISRLLSKHCCKASLPSLCCELAFEPMGNRHCTGAPIYRNRRRIHSISPRTLTILQMCDVAWRIAQNWLVTRKNDMIFSPRSQTPCVLRHTSLSAFPSWAQV